MAPIVATILTGMAVKIGVGLLASVAKRLLEPSAASPAAPPATFEAMLRAETRPTDGETSSRSALAAAGPTGGPTTSPGTPRLASLEFDARTPPPLPQVAASTRRPAGAVAAYRRVDTTWS